MLSIRGQQLSVKSRQRFSSSTATSSSVRFSSLRISTILFSVSLSYTAFPFEKVSHADCRHILQTGLLKNRVSIKHVLAVKGLFTELALDFCRSGTAPGTKAFSVQFLQAFIKIEFHLDVFPVGAFALIAESLSAIRTVCKTVSKTCHPASRSFMSNSLSSRSFLPERDTGQAVGFGDCLESFKITDPGFCRLAVFKIVRAASTDRPLIEFQGRPDGILGT